MAEDLAEVKVGPINAASIRVKAKANGAIAQWAPVILIAPAAGETYPRVGTTTTVGDPLVYGIKDSPNKTLVAGNFCRVVTHGITKMVFAGAAALGDPLEASATAGRGQVAAKAVIGDLDDIFAKAISATPAAAADIGLVYVGKGVGA